MPASLMNLFSLDTDQYIIDPVTSKKEARRPEQLPSPIRQPVFLAPCVAPALEPLQLSGPTPSVCRYDALGAVYCIRTFHINK